MGRLKVSRVVPYTALQQLANSLQCTVAKVLVGSGITIPATRIYNERGMTASSAAKIMNVYDKEFEVCLTDEVCKQVKHELFRRNSRRDEGKALLEGTGVAERVEPLSIEQRMERVRLHLFGTIRDETATLLPFTDENLKKIIEAADASLEGGR